MASRSTFPDYNRDSEGFRSKRARLWHHGAASSPADQWNAFARGRERGNELREIGRRDGYYNAHGSPIRRENDGIWLMDHNSYVHPGVYSNPTAIPPDWGLYNKQSEVYPTQRDLRLDCGPYMQHNAYPVPTDRDLRRQPDAYRGPADRDLCRQPDAYPGPADWDIRRQPGGYPTPAVSSDWCPRNRHDICPIPANESSNWGRTSISSRVTFPMGMRNDDDVYFRHYNRDQSDWKRDMYWRNDPMTREDFRSAKPVYRNKIKERELQELLERRQKQIDYGKNTTSYRRYLKAVPKDSRTRRDPTTPNKYLRCSRRSWDTQIKLWRKKLHLYDADPNTDFDCDIDLSDFSSEFFIN